MPNVAFNKFNDFVEQLGAAKHDLTSTGHVLKVYLSNELPLAADTVKTDIAEITVQFGYTPAGGVDIQNACSETGGVLTVTGTDVTWTASGGSFGPFRYAVIYNDTQTSPADPLVGWYDYGSAITVNDGEQFVIDFTTSFFTLS